MKRTNGNVNGQEREKEQEQGGNSQHFLCKFLILFLTLGLKILIF
jgi:hypothetical protein